MRKIRLLALICCMGVMLCMIFGCSKGDDKEALSASTSDVVTDTPYSAGEEDDNEPVKITSLKINGVDISEYRIVYRTEFTREECFEYYNLYANELIKEFEDKLGVKLDAVPDTQTATQYEILLGKTKGRSELGQVAQPLDDIHGVICKNGKLLMSAPCLAGVVNAVELFWEQVNDEARKNDGAVDISKDLNVKKNEHVTRIVCVGDSITMGTGTQNHTKSSYPTRLQYKLGYEYDVVNYGLSGETMCSEGLDYFRNRSYIYKSGYYDDLLRVASKADAVIIMLGTNDGNNTVPGATELLKNNFSAVKQNYTENLTKMVNELRAKNKDIKILLCNAPRSTDPTTESNLATYIRPLQKTLSEELGTEFFDMNGFMTSKMNNSHFADIFHLNEAGYIQMASGIAQTLKEQYGFSYAN